MAGNLRGQNIFFFGLIREDGFADYIAANLVQRGATVYCLAAPELTEEREAELAQRKIHVIKSPLWYGLKDDEYPEAFKSLKKPEDILNYSVDADFIDNAFAVSEKSASNEVRKIFIELGLKTKGKVDGIIHIMAGGIPRTRGMMMLTKAMLGTADPAKFIPMQRFVDSDVFQKIVARNINLVTATSYEHIFTSGNAVLAANPRCKIIALGYNGEHIMDTNHTYSFSSYPGYLVGYAKKHLLEIAERYRAKSYKATVVNLMGAETASTNAFAGIENFVVNSFRQMDQAGHEISTLKQQCEALLKPGITMEQVVANADQYLYAPAIQGIQDGSFPLLTSLATAEVTLQVSEQFQDFHIDRKKLVAYEISRFVKTLMAERFWDQFDENTSSTLLLDVKQLMEQ